MKKKKLAVHGDRVQLLERKLTEGIFSNEAADYDAKHEKTTAEIARRLEARRGLIGVEWLEEDDSSDEQGVSTTDAVPARAVRVLDYACGTGSMSRVSNDPVLTLQWSEVEVKGGFLNLSSGRMIVSLCFASSLKPKTNHCRFDRRLRHTRRNVWALTFLRRWWTCITPVLGTR